MNLLSWCVRAGGMILNGMLRFIIVYSILLVPVFVGFPILLHRRTKK